MPPFLLFPRPIFFPFCAFLNSSPKSYHPLQLSSLINMNRSRQPGSFTNQHNTSSSSDSGTPHHPNQDNSSAWVLRKNKTEPYRHPHQREASPGIVEGTSSGTSQEKPVLVPRAVSQHMGRSSYRGRPFVAASSSESSMRGANSEISQSRKGGWGPNSQMSSLKSNYVPANRRDQVNATHTEKYFPAATISESTMGQTSAALKDGSPLHSHLHGAEAGGIVESFNRGQGVVGRLKSPERSRRVIPRSRSTSPKMEYAYFGSTEAVIRPSEIEQNEIKEHVSPDHSKIEIFKQRRSSPKRDYSHYGPGDADDMAYPPFDLFIQKPKAPVLKASLFEKNREKRKGREPLLNDPRPDTLRPGMVLQKNFITLDDQIKIFKKCRDTGLGPGGFYQPGYTDGAKLHLHMMCLGKDWDPQTRSYTELRSIDGVKPPIIPDDFRKLVNDAIQASHAMIRVKGERHPHKAIPLMEPDICIVNFYSNTGKLGLHQDRDESLESLKNGLPVVSFSIGDTAEFLYGEDADVDKAEKIELKSGDVLIFGGKSRHIFHAVPSIIPKTAPKFLDEVNLRPGRLNLTFRKY